MDLLLLTVDWPPIEGGIATLSAGIARALARRGHRLSVLAPARPGTPRREEQAHGLRIERWPGYALGPCRWLPFAGSSLRRLRRHDAVLAMNPAYGGLVAGLGRAAGGPPFLAWAYGFELLKARGTPLALLYRAMFSRAGAAIAISRRTRDLLLDLGVPPPRIALVPPGVDPPAPPAGAPGSVRARLGLPSGPIVLTVGRLVSRKGHLELLEAMALVRERRPDVVWAVAGRGPLGNALHARALALGLASRLRLLGYVLPEDLEALYREATVFALLPLDRPGDVEGFGIVFLEAGARGLPVVAGRSGGVVDAVEEGSNGLLVEPEDAVGAAAAILRLLEDPALARRLGDGGRDRAARHSWERAAQAVEGLLERDAP